MNKYKFIHLYRYCELIIYVLGEKSQINLGIVDEWIDIFTYIKTTRKVFTLIDSRLLPLFTGQFVKKVIFND